MNADTNNGDESGERSAEGATSYSRRTYLQGLLGAATGAAALKAVPTARASSWPQRFDRYFNEFDNVVNVVDAGADPNGEESITPLLREYRQNDTLLAFPPGRYFMGSNFRFTGFENFGLVGHDATIVPPNYHNIKYDNPRLFHLGIRYDPATRAVVDGFTIDQTAPDTGIRAIEACVNDGLEVRNITIDGVHDSGTWGPGRFVVWDPDGSGVVENFTATDGGAWTKETPNAGNLWRGPTGIISNMNKGTLTFEDCEVGSFPDNGLYAANGSGRINVRGGRYFNSHASNIRIGGHDCLVKDVDVVMENPPDNVHDMDGIRITTGGGHMVKHTNITHKASISGVRPVTIDNAVDDTTFWGDNIEIDAPGHNTAISVHSDAGHVRVYGGGIQHDGPSDSGGYGIYLGGKGNEEGATIENFTIKGDVGQRGGRCGIFNNRDNVLISGVIHQPGGRKRSAIVNNGTDCQIHDGDYRASRFPIDERGVGTWIESIYAKSYNGDEAIRLKDTCEHVYLKDNTFRGGLRDEGTTSLQLESNRGL